MLTDLACKASIKKSTTTAKRIKAYDSKGLYLECKPNGAAHWRYKYRVHGKEKLLSFGPYPTISLSDARTKQAAAHRQLLDHIDPSQARKSDRQVAVQVGLHTFEFVGRAWHKHNLAKWSPNHARTIMLRLEKDLFSCIGYIPVKDLTRKMLLSALQKIEARKKHETARRSLQYATNILRYAVLHDHAPSNVALDLEGALQPTKRGHFPSMEIEKLPEFLRKFYSNEACLTKTTRQAMEMLMLTLVRTKELIAAEWTEFDFGKAMWAIPAPKMKMRREHLVPLSKQVLAILLDRKRANDLLEPLQRSKYVFPSQLGPHKHLSERTVGLALFAMGYRGIHTGHGFRALGMGIAKEKLGYRHEVPDRQLSHVPANEIDRAYDRAKYLPERIEMMQRLADYCCERKAVDVDQPVERSDTKPAPALGQGAIPVGYQFHFRQENAAQY